MANQWDRDLLPRKEKKAGLCSQEELNLPGKVKYTSYLSGG